MFNIYIYIFFFFFLLFFFLFFFFFFDQSLNLQKIYAIARNAIYQSSDSGNNWSSIRYNFTIIDDSLIFNHSNQKAMIIGNECNFICTKNVCLNNE